MQNIKKLIHNNKGIAAVEFALALPFLLSLFIGSYELARYMLINAKLENVSYTISDIITQQTSLTTAQLDQYMVASTQITLPYDFADGGGTVIVSAVYKDENLANPTVSWQYYYGQTGRASTIGTVNNNATLPVGFALNDKENIIVTEVFYDFVPIFSAFSIGTANVYKTAYFKPRFGALTNAPN